MSGPTNIQLAHFLEQLDAKEQEAFKKHGWYAHYVYPETPDGMLNAHTHGLTESLDHLDIQIVFPLPPETVHAVLADAVNLIRKLTDQGSGIVPDALYDEVLKGYKVKFIMAKEGRRDVLRMILPDAGGNLDRRLMTSPTFQRQYDDLD